MDLTKSHPGGIPQTVLLTKKAMTRLACWIQRLLPQIESTLLVSIWCRLCFPHCMPVVCCILRIGRDCHSISVQKGSCRRPKNRGHRHLDSRRDRVVECGFPTTLDKIIEAAKNYVLYPAPSAAGGYLSGGVPGAVVSRGSHQVGQAIKDIFPTQTSQVTKIVQDTAAAVASVIKNIEAEQKKQDENVQRTPPVHSQTQHKVTSSPVVIPLPLSEMPPPIEEQALTTV